MPRPEALNEQPAMARWTAEPKRDNDRNEVTDEKDGKRYHDEPRPTKRENDKYADEEKREPAAGPNNQPRLSIEPSGDALLDYVH
jgi:hypothetical protein